MQLVDLSFKSSMEPTIAPKASGPSYPSIYLSDSKDLGAAVGDTVMIKAIVREVTEREDGDGESYSYRLDAVGADCSQCSGSDEIAEGGDSADSLNATLSKQLFKKSRDAAAAADNASNDE